MDHLFTLAQSDETSRDILEKIYSISKKKGKIYSHLHPLIHGGKFLFFLIRILNFFHQHKGKVYKNRGSEEESSNKKRKVSSSRKKNFFFASKQKSGNRKNSIKRVKCLMNKLMKRVREKKIFAEMLEHFSYFFSFFLLLLFPSSFDKTLKPFHEYKIRKEYHCIFES